MPFNQFICIAEKKETPSSFITSKQICHHIDLPIKMVICNYELDRFTPDLFDYYQIPPPLDISKSVNKRQAEFLAGRVAATEALKQIDPSSHEMDIKVSENRAPKWPEGIIGSITHSSSIAASVVSDVKSVGYLGIDIEDNLDEEVRIQISDQIHSAEESKVLTSLGINNAQATTLIFSAKEALFKALFQYVNEYFGFECASVVGADLRNNTLVLRLDDKFKTKHKLSSIYKCSFKLFASHTYTLLY